MKITPLKDRVLIKQCGEEEKTESGIYLAKGKKQYKGEVLQVGKGKFNDKGERVPMSVKVGDVVVYSKWAEQGSHRVDDMIVIKEEDIVAVLDV